jgi:hypothetical protein
VDREAAVSSLVTDFYAASNSHVVEAKWRTITSAVKKWGLEPLPPTRDVLLALGAALKAGGYRSSETYLSLWKITAERNGYVLEVDVLRLLKDVTRSCKRGRGAPVKPLALPLERLDDLPDGFSAWHKHGPVGPKAAIAAGSWFLTRESELSTTRANFITFGSDPRLGGDTVTWALPASKSDPEAKGLARTHGCCCGSKGWACPVHLLREHLKLLRAHFKILEGAAFPIDFPLFPDEAGMVVAKDSMTMTIQTAATHLKIPLVSADGSSRISGHSLRVTGAQGLARAGVDTWAIQLLGRWGSSAVLGYIMDVPLTNSALWSRRAARGWTLEEAVSAFNSPDTPVENADLLANLPAAAGSPEVLQQALGHEANIGSAPPDDEDCFILSSGYRGHWHRVPPSGRVGLLSEWSTICGWKYSSSSSSLEPLLPAALPHKALCAKCLPEAWAAARTLAVP